MPQRPITSQGTNRRRGFILPLVLILLFVLMVLGGTYLFSSVQSKNVFAVFYRDDLARLVAESAVEEWRAGFSRHLRSEPPLRALVETPRKPGLEPVRFTLSQVPTTQAMVRNRIGSALGEMTCTLTVLDLDDKLVEWVGALEKKSAFGNEYQATLRFDVWVGIGPEGERKFSNFVYEFDLKHVCLRSHPTTRTGRGFMSNLTNDYAVFLRRGWEEFEATDGGNLNHDEVPLSIVRPAGRGKVLLGGLKRGEAENTSRQVFLNVVEGMEDLVPKPPADIEVSWNDFKTYLPIRAKVIEDAFSTAGMPVPADKVKAALVRENVPLAGCDEWLAALPAKTREAMVIFHEKARRFGPRKATNRGRPINLLGLGGRDLDGCKNIEGNVRKRFWQTVWLRLDLRLLLDSLPISEADKDKIMRENDPNLAVPYLAPLEWNMITMGGGGDPKARELYGLVKAKQDAHHTVLTSQPVEDFAFIPKEAEHVTPPAIPLPGPIAGRTGLIEPNEYLPFTSFLTRSHRFEDARDIYQSHFFDPARNVLILDGITMISDLKPFHLKPDLKFVGEGILLGYGDIVIANSFQPDTSQPQPGASGLPFAVLYTYRGNIIANAESPGRIQASLVALNFKYDPGRADTWSRVLFSTGRADVTGNLAADCISLTNMARLPRSTKFPDGNLITYDADTLSGDDLYHTTLGGRLRLMNGAYNQPR